MDQLHLILQREDGKPVTEIVQVYDALLKPDSELSSPAATLNATDILASMKIAKPLNEFAKDKNNCILVSEDYKRRQQLSSNWYGFIFMKCLRTTQLKIQTTSL